MSASLHTLHVPGRFPVRGSAGFDTGFDTRLDAGSRSASALRGGTWIVDQAALRHCRAVLLGHAEDLALLALGRRAPMLVPMDVPPDYDRFCRAHFASMRRVHAELDWDEAVPAYAVALAAHAALCVALDDAREALLERNWDSIRGASTLAWADARPLIAAGCSALDRIDPLAMPR